MSVKILGISGFEGAVPFKRAHLPQLDEREYRISQGHDSAAALVVDGTVVAAVAEERISRKKHTGAFPKGAIAYCLAEAGVTIDQIDELAHGFDYAPYRGIYSLDPESRDLYRQVYSREALLALVTRDFPAFPAERVHHVAHHLAHAASAYYTSGWDECLVVVIDGMGEAHSVSVYRAHDGRLDLLFQIAAQDSIGILYSAATLHACLDRAMLHLCSHFAAATGQRRLALAGGVALNCTANGKLLCSGMFDEVYVQPAAGDDGSALGAALYRASLAGEVRNERMPVPILRPGDAQRATDIALRAYGDRIRVTRFDTLAQACGEAARLIADGRVVAWYRGRMEFGPRALGHRSILADPGHPEMRDRINAMVKMREAFRPFAPAVSIEQVDRWFDVPPMTALPFMIMTVDVRREFRQDLPAITHVNGSARVQTVSATDNPEFHALLQAVGKVTGREMVLNTSFN